MSEKKKTTQKKNTTTKTTSASTSKKSPQKNGGGKTSSGAKKPTQKKTQSEVKAQAEPTISPANDPSSIRNTAFVIVAYIFAFLSVLFFIAGIKGAQDSPLISVFCKVLYGLFGYGAFVTVVVLIIEGFTWKENIRKGTGTLKLIWGFIFTVSVSLLFHSVGVAANIFESTSSVSELFGNGNISDGGVTGGGVIGGLLSYALYALISYKAVVIIITTILFIVALMAFMQLTPAKLYRICRAAFTPTYEEEERREIKREKKRLKKERMLEERARRLAEEEEEEELQIELEEEERQRRIAEKKEREREKAEASRKAKLEADKKRPKTSDDDIDDFGDDTYTDTNDDSEEEKAPEPKKEVKKPEPKKSPKKEKEIEIDFDDDEDDEDDPIDIEETDVDDIFTEDFKTPEEKKKEKETEKKRRKKKGEDATETPDEAEPEQEETVEDEFGPESSEPEEEAYKFPTPDLLTLPPETTEKLSPEELKRNAERLIEVLASFKVETTLVNISQGPTVTRYELAPKAGVRVKQIANLVDDIALCLETSGIRIEAPIPGKAAVGIEVPNRVVSTVYLRELIECEKFKNSKSRITACLGKDVAGAPVVIDIAKMPHLLVAGATGMGKSVSLNSIIVSLLYKASPDELKLILVDPKKVEMAPYNKLPHLLIPVVSSPKKAAGALATAVTEMERRFELIESEGVRDIKSYNASVANDPTKEKLPHIIIIIDELADLMFTAKDTVEDSICRLAQKARAAGMHLIVCTQRPSVDVITGLIKANIPSRLAFTVASLVDSRTILDVAGAEKLIGRGDMLFSPVDAMKPIRAQGAFVSDDEVEAVTNFIKEQSSQIKYDDNFIKKVEEAAEQCDSQKKPQGGDSDSAPSHELDPKFWDACDLAFEMGKMSTSFLQRKLSLGYGRAAKIVDSMEAMGIVGPADGQKPRPLTISREDYLTLRMRGGRPSSSDSDIDTSPQSSTSDDSGDEEFDLDDI